MIVDALESVYVAVRRIQQREGEENARIDPAFFLFLLLAPVIHSILVLVVPATWGMDAATANYSSLRSVPLLYLVAGALAVGVIWVGFDRRRDSLDRTYSNLPSLVSVKRRIVAVILFSGAVGGITWLAFKWPIVCPFLFLALCAALSTFMRASRH